jgi:proteasome lid subunit RPN8/RPN11
MNVVLDKALQSRIIQQLEGNYPNEGGGFLLGRLDGDTVHITETTGIQNIFAEEEQFHRYAMTPQDWMRLEDAADARGLALVGYYHSHPNAPAIPSIYDRDHALPNFTYLITSVREAKAAEMRAWRLRADRLQFDEESLAIHD